MRHLSRGSGSSGTSGFWRFLNPGASLRFLLNGRGFFLFAGFFAGFSGSGDYFHIRARLQRTRERKDPDATGSGSELFPATRVGFAPLGRRSRRI